MAELNNPLLPSPASSSDDRRQWERIFTALVETVQSQQSQIETLVDDRKFFEDSISLQRSRSASRIALLKSHISQMKKEDEMVRRVYASRLNLMVSSKERETLLYKKQLELAESDRDDFHVCVESLGAEMLELKEKLKCTVPDKGDTGIDGLKEKEQHIVDLEKEIRKMKHEYKKLISKKDSDISALIAEKDFIWNQFKMKDDEFMSLLKKKQMDDERASEMIKMQMEDKHANEIIKMLQCSLEMLQSMADEKDQTIANLAAGRAILESDVGRLTQEADQMKHRIEAFDKHRIENVVVDGVEIDWEGEMEEGWVKEINCLEWESFAFHPSPLIVLIFERYNRTADNWKFLKELEKAAKVYWSAKDRLPPRTVKIDINIERDLAYALKVKECPQLLFLKGSKILYREKEIRTSEELVKMIAHFYYNAKRPSWIDDEAVAPPF